MTTDQVFGERLHTYTVVDAIRDKKCAAFASIMSAPFANRKILRMPSVWDIDRERILLAPKRIDNIVKIYTRKFRPKNQTQSYYRLRERRLAGFNSILATASIDAAKRYYAEFQKQMADCRAYKQ
jgi:type I restriction enzyme R subunit